MNLSARFRLVVRMLHEKCIFRISEMKGKFYAKRTLTRSVLRCQEKKTKVHLIFQGVYPTTNETKVKILFSCVDLIDKDFGMKIVVPFCKI